MPFLCPGGSLWRRGKHARQGGHRDGSRHVSTASRKVSTKGTLVHPFIQQQVDIAGTMSPGITGGVYMGPDKYNKRTPAGQDKKLAEIRSPMDYYTDGKVLIGQDEINKEEVQSGSHGHRVEKHVHHDPVTTVDAQHNDTLNPDGTLASIVYFEETFMSAKFSHLSTSSPRCNVNSGRTLPNHTNDPSTKGVSSTPANRIMRRPDIIQGPTENRDSTLGVPLSSSSSLTRRSTSNYSKTNHGYPNIIPNWVRQRRCLPTLDEIDFDQIDVISLHSLPTSERHIYQSPCVTNTVDDSRSLIKSPEKRQKMKDDYPSTKCMISRKGKALLQDGQTNDEILSNVPNGCREVLSDLTNVAASPMKISSRSNANKSAFYKMPKRNAAVERRSRRNHKSGKKQPNDVSGDSLLNAVEKFDDHTYVNLEYIAGITTNSPPNYTRSDSDSDVSVHTYENIWCSSVSKGAQSKQRSSHSSGRLGRPHGRNKIQSPAITNNGQRKLKTSQRGRHRSLQLHRGYRKLSHSDDLEISDDLALWEASQSKPTPSRKSLQFPAGIRETFEDDVPMKEKLSSVSSWESTTNTHSTEGEECAAILSGATEDNGLRMETRRPVKLDREMCSKSPQGKGTTMVVKCSGKDDFILADQRRANDCNTGDVKELIDKPSYADNTIRKARIVRTNSTEEGNDIQKPETHLKISSVQSQHNRKYVRFAPKKSTHIETRRSLPTPSTVGERSVPLTPQRRSATNVRVVEAELGQKQKRKIRRTIEGDDVMKALLTQDNRGPPSTRDNDSINDPRSLLSDASSKDEVSRVQKIIHDWNESSKEIASRAQCTHYVGTHVHAGPAHQQEEEQQQQVVCTRALTSREREQDTKHLGSGIRWRKGDKQSKDKPGNNENPRKPIEILKRESGNRCVTVSRSEVRHIPSVASAFDNTVVPRKKTANVIEIYIATQPHDPVERDEIETQHGELLVVNSAMQRENDWMWVYVPRTDRFGYVPPFAARPLEFECNQV